MRAAHKTPRGSRVSSASESTSEESCQFYFANAQGYRDAFSVRFRARVLNNAFFVATRHRDDAVRAVKNRLGLICRAKLRELHATKGEALVG